MSVTTENEPVIEGDVDDFIENEIPMVFAAHGEEKAEPGTPEFYINIGVCTCKYSYNIM